MNNLKWEYEFITSKYDVGRTMETGLPSVLYQVTSRNGDGIRGDLYLHKVANELGNDGWEIVSDVVISDGKLRETVFKRSKTA